MGEAVSKVREMAREEVGPSREELKRELRTELREELFEEIRMERGREIEALEERCLERQRQDIVRLHQNLAAGQLKWMAVLGAGGAYSLSKLVQARGYFPKILLLPVTAYVGTMAYLWQKKSGGLVEKALK